MAELLKRTNIWTKLRLICGLQEPTQPIVHSEVITPVVIVNDASQPVEVRPGFLVLNENQTYIEQTQERDLAANVAEVYYTVTTGKTLYIAAMLCNSSAAAGTAFTFGDAITAAPAINTAVSNAIQFYVTSNRQMEPIVLPIPLKIVTNLSGITGAISNLGIAFVGWEE